MYRGPDGTPHWHHSLRRPAHRRIAHPQSVDRLQRDLAFAPRHYRCLGYACPGTALCITDPCRWQEQPQAHRNGYLPLCQDERDQALQVAFLPSWPQYCGATPSDSVPFLGSAVSSITSQAGGQPTSLSASRASTDHSGLSSQAGLASAAAGHGHPDPGERPSASGFCAHQGRASPKVEGCPDRACLAAEHLQERRQLAIQVSATTMSGGHSWLPLHRSTGSNRFLATKCPISIRSHPLSSGF